MLPATYLDAAPKGSRIIMTSFNKRSPYYKHVIMLPHVTDGLAPQPFDRGNLCGQEKHDNSEYSNYWN
jgi:hypothetical protein